MQEEDLILLIVIVSSLGFISLSHTLFKILKIIWLFFLRSPKDLIKTYGSWVLITGSTDGIGKSLAFQFASKGLNLILVGRNPRKLQATCQEILLKHCVQIKTIVIDFNKMEGIEVCKAIKDGIEGVDVGILINNVGLAYPYARFCHEVDVELMESVIRVNVGGSSWVTKAVIPGMLERKRGAIVNMGSGSSGVVSSYPLYAIYAATKAYIAMFSKSISLEYKQQGIHVQCQIPLLVATKMASIRRSSLFIPSADTFSKASIRWIGYENMCVPYWPHYLQCCFFSHVLRPDSFQDWCLFRYFLGMRNRGLAKDSAAKTNTPNCMMHT